MAYNGQLNHSEIFSAIYNMIISQEVFADNLGKHQTLVDMARVDGGLTGDTKLYYATNVLKSAPWGKDAEAANLLTLFRPASPNCQKITLDQFRQIALTVDNYLTKRAFADEGTFGQFNQVMLGWMSETKKVYESTLYQTYIGTTATATGKQTQEVTLTGTNDGQTIAEKVANILVEMGDYNTDYNDLGYLRSYSNDQIKVIWNSKYVNKIRKVDTPTIFHRDGLVDKLDELVMPARYFGRAVAASDKGEGKVIGSGGLVDATKGSVRSRVEKTFIFAGNPVHMFPGDLLATGMQVGGTGHPDFAENEVYIEDENIIAKIVTKLPPIMSAFEAGTSFFNPKALVESHFLTWGHNTLVYFEDKPFVTLKKAA